MKAATFSGHTDVSLVLILVDLAGHMITSCAATIVFLDSLCAPRYFSDGATNLPIT